ncbi:MAG: hypothetical protein IPM38_04570 [Ignavibacteria bacterium]|nr:hypothetical protein [Ignavibacteria bacterium]
MSDNINNPDSNSPQDKKPSENHKDKDPDKLESKESAGSESDKPAEDHDGSAVSKKDEVKEPSSELPVKPVKSTAATNKPKVSNYQISLIDENYLKITVVTKKGIKINSALKETNKNADIQNNEIYLNPRLDLAQQEVEIHITIDENSTKDQTKNAEEELTDSSKLNDNILKETGDDEDEGESKFKVSPVNENLLKVRIETDKSVKIDSVAKDKRTSLQTQSNRVLILTDSDNKKHNIEITIELDPEIKDITEELSGSSKDGKIKLIPNPEVVDLIQPPDYSNFPQDPELELDDTGFENPFDSLRQLIRKNLTIGIVIAVILHLSVAALAFYTIGKRSKDEKPEEQQRLIVLQDLPDPKIMLQNVEDPNKPKVEEIPAEENKNEREITPRRVIQPPRVSRPPERKRDDDTLTESALNRELDSLRRLAEELDTDSTVSAPDTLISNYVIPDSLRNNFSEQDIGLGMYFPNNWKLTDQRDINKNEKDFKGVVLTDTTAEQPGTMTMFIFLDSDLKDYNTEDFTAEFPMNDTTLSGFVKEPKTLAGFTEYRFYIFNTIGTEKLSLRASVRKQYFDQYKNEIEAVVRSINIRKNINKIDSTDAETETIPEDESGTE